MIRRTFILLSVILIFTIVVINQLNKQKFNHAAVLSSETNGCVFGLILPHHETAQPIVISSLEKLSNEKYQTIIILSPNHYYPDSDLITTANAIEGLPIKSDSVNELVNEHWPLKLNNEVVKNEHGITAFAPLFRKYFPEAQIIPLVFAGHYSGRDLAEIAEYFKKKYSENVLYIVSIDFSHNSTLLEGLQKNAESVEAIRNFDYQTILDYGDDHLDSPVALSQFLLIMEQMQTKKWELWENSHAALINNTPHIAGTSYVIGVFSKN